MGRNQRDEPVNTWTTANVSTDPTINADGLVAEIGDGLCTLLDELAAVGVISK